MDTRHAIGMRRLPSPSEEATAQMTISPKVASRRASLTIYKTPKSYMCSFFEVRPRKTPEHTLPQQRGIIERPNIWPLVFTKEKTEKGTYLLAVTKPCGVKVEILEGIQVLVETNVEINKALVEICEDCMRKVEKELIEQKSRETGMSSPPRPPV
jgi:hypothetical protein